MNKYGLNLARSCLRCIVKVFGIKELFIPYYICPSVWQALQKEGCKINFYNINESFYPKQNFDKSDYILYPNYFGICSENVNKLSKIYPNLIVDNAHSFFAKPLGIASFNSIRKFFNIQEGAFLYSKKNIEENYPVSKINKVFDLKKEDEFLQNELLLDSTGIKSISADIINKFNLLNLKEEADFRVENFKYLHNKYSDKNLLKLPNSLFKDKYFVPYCYPYLTIDGIMPDELKSKRIFRYWKPMPKYFTEQFFYTNLICIPLNNFQ